MRKFFSLFIVAAMLLSFVGCGMESGVDAIPGENDYQSAAENDVVDTPEYEEPELEIPEFGGLETCEIVMIDCGQADSILIMAPEGNVLIDAGEDKDAHDIMETLSKYDIHSIDIMIGTHAHADHIGGMQTIVENYDIEKIILSPTPHTSKTFENLINAIEVKGCDTEKAKPGTTHNLGDLEIEIIAPVEDYEELNASSVVAIVSYGEADFLFTGDAEKDAEEDFINNVRDVEVLKAGHHGSSTSSSELLLDKAQPEIVIISCGEGNSYGHPHKEALDRFQDYGMQIYRTDELGDIVLKTDGFNIEVTSENGEKVEFGTSDNSTVENETNTSDINVENTDDVTVYVTKSGTKFHQSESCVSLKNSTSVGALPMGEAIGQGYERCSKCF